MYKVDQQQIRSDRVVYSGRSPYQQIELLHGKDGLSLFLDGEVQFVESEERQYHHALASAPFQRQPRIQNVLLMGAGDGLAARNIYENNPQANVYLCELDGVLVNVFKQNPECRRLTRNSLQKCKMCIGDATATIRNFHDNSMDLVIGDFPDYGVGTLDLYGAGLYGDVHRVLRKYGVVSLYSSGLDMRNELSDLFANFQVCHIPKGKMGELSIINGIVRK